MVQVPGDGWKRRAAIAGMELVERFYRRDPLLPPFSMRRFVGEARWDLGGDDFRNNGRHFAEKLRDAGLGATSHVLDIGSGCGRIAVPLTEIIDSRGSYIGLELSPPLVDWCSSHITTKHPQFRFVRSDLFNPLYNPAGNGDALTYRFPLDDSAFDLVVATSVFTHFLPEIAIHYFRECARVLQPGGRLFATFYFVDTAIQSVESNLRFEHPWGPQARVANLACPEAAIGFNVDWVLGSASMAGLEIEPPVRWGTWSGRKDGYSGQDVAIFRRLS